MQQGKRKRAFDDEPLSKRRNIEQSSTQQNTVGFSSSYQQSQNNFPTHGKTEDNGEFQNYVDSMDILSDSQRQETNSLAIVLYRPPEEVVLQGLNKQTRVNSVYE